METLWVLTAIAMVVAWLLFLGGCGAVGRTQGSVQQALLERDEALLRELQELRRERRAEAVAVASASDDESDSQTTIVYVLDGNFGTYSDCDVSRELRHEQRSLQREIRKLRHDVRRYSSGGRHRHHHHHHPQH